MADNQENLNSSERLEAYLRRWMSPEDEVAFEEELRSDPDLMSEMESKLLEMAQGQAIGLEINATRFDAMFDGAQLDYSQALRKLRIRNGFLIGAGSALAIAVGVWLATPKVKEPVPEPPIELMEEVFSPPLFIAAEKLPDNLSEEEITLRKMVARGDSAFASGNFARAIELYNVVPTEFLPAGEQARIALMMGGAMLDQGQDSMAVEILRNGFEQPDSPLKAYLEWYLALAYLDGDVKDSTKLLLDQILLDPLHPFRIKADSLKAKLFRLDKESEN
ncbi:MAG: hypothetical protein MRZ79_13450 [Bacteroidia bacterium]|nr:hypothetical protein [Bacteroidia bacterium]